MEGDTTEALSGTGDLEGSAVPYKFKAGGAAGGGVGGSWECVTKSKMKLRYSGSNN